MAISRDNGEVVQKIVYNPFGKMEEILDKNLVDISSNPFFEMYISYTGREWDEESGLYYYRARYYDAEVGRFLEIDPAGGSISSPKSLNNKYIYAQNNPIQYTDPSGKFIFTTAFLYTVLTSMVITGAIQGTIHSEQGGSFWRGFAAGAVAGGMITTLSIVTGGLGGGVGWAFLGGAVGGGMSTFSTALIYGNKISEVPLGAVLINMALGGTSGAVAYASYARNVSIDSFKKFLYESSPSVAVDANRTAVSNLPFEFNETESSKSRCIERHSATGYCLQWASSEP